MRLKTGVSSLAFGLCLDVTPALAQKANFGTMDEAKAMLEKAAAQN